MAKNRVCLFCGNGNLSKEHIFAQWLLKELGIMDNDVSMTHMTAIGMEVSNRKHAFSKLVNGLVCEKCNNGWMSDLEGQCQFHIINLMNMEKLDEEMNFLKENHETVAKWAFKNVIMLNSATNYRQLVPENHYHSLYQGNIPKGVTIDMAFASTDPTVEWRQSPGSLVIKDKKIPMKYDTNKYIITFQIKYLMIKVAFYESDNQTFYEDEGCIRLYPDFCLYEGDKIVYKNIDEFDVHGVVHEYIKDDLPTEQQ